MDLIEEKMLFLRQLKNAVEANDIDDFLEMVDAGITYFSEEAVAALLTRELPLLLGDRLTWRMHFFMRCAMAQTNHRARG